MAMVVLLLAHRLDWKLRSWWGEGNYKWEEGWASGDLVIDPPCSAQPSRTLESEELFKPFSLGSNRESQGWGWRKKETSQSAPAGSMEWPLLTHLLPEGGTAAALLCRDTHLLLGLQGPQQAGSGKQGVWIRDTNQVQGSANHQRLGLQQFLIETARRHT